MTNRNLALTLEATAEHQARRPALVLDQLTTTYGQLDDDSARVAGVLRKRGVGPGDRVGIMLPNVSAFPVVYYGVLRAGGVVVPMNPLLKQREVAFYLGDSGAKLVFAWHDFAGAAQAGATEAKADCVVVTSGDFESLLASTDPVVEMAERDGEDTAVILYTSGTTGKPKGAELTHCNLSRNAEVAVDLFDLTVQSVVMGTLPLFHAFGQTCALNATVRAGGSLALMSRFDGGRALETIQRRRVTVFMGVPTMYSALLNHPERDRFDTSSLRIVVSGGAALPIEVLHGFEQAFSCKVLEGYGLSETSPVASFNPREGACRAGSIGLPVEGVQMRVVDDERKPTTQGEVGEVAIRGHNIMKGYWNLPDATAEAIDADGWFYTGDMARVDEDGYFYIVDRKKDMIIRGGYNVYPREIEEVLYEHPAIQEAAVVGIPHPELGEEVAAAVALKPGAEVSEADVRDFVKERVAAYKYPRKLWFVDDLPKGPTGKILKRAIAAPAETENMRS